MVDGEVGEENRVLKPANENPWYVLMTLYGEQDGEEIDWELHEKNRAAWNAWAGFRLPANARQELATLGNSLLANEEWNRIGAEVRTKHYDEMIRRNDINFVDSEFPEPETCERIDLSDLSIENHLVADEMVFHRDTYFQHSVFLRLVSFRNVFFAEMAFFAHTNFKQNANFQDGVFNANAVFRDSTFLESAIFGQVKFRGWAVFSSIKFFKVADFGITEFGLEALFGNTQFIGTANFNNAYFSKIASFSGHLTKFAKAVEFVNCTFEQVAEFRMVIFESALTFHKTKFCDFSSFNRATFGALESAQIRFTDCEFLKPTDFRDAIFKNNFPDFTRTSLHENTPFAAHKKNWPESKQANPRQAKASCAVIRHALNKQGLPEEEHFFFRREMMLSAQSVDKLRRLPYRLFGVFSDYGYSIARPVISLFWVWLISALVFAAFRVTGVPLADLSELLWSGALSFANLFPVFGFHRVWFDADKLAALSPWLKALAGAQTVVSLPLLFFLGLGLRTRFRMR